MTEPEFVEKEGNPRHLDEGGGYYDSGYIQPVNFFGDGPRVPFRRLPVRQARHPSITPITTMPPS